MLHSVQNNHVPFLPFHRVPHYKSSSDADSKYKIQFIKKSIKYLIFCNFHLLSLQNTRFVTG